MLRAGSVKSKNSERSVGRYKRVSHTGGADESLFGSQPAAGSRKVEQMLRQPPAQGDKVEFDSVVITTSDLQRLRMAASAEGPGAADRRALAVMLIACCKRKLIWRITSNWRLL